MAYRRGRGRGRSRLIGRLSVFLGVLAGLGALGFSAYQSGTVLARLEVTNLEQRNDALTHQLDAATARASALDADLGTARQAIEAMRKRYEAEVPTGAAASLLDIARERMRKGIRAERLADVLKNTGEPRVCDAAAVRRRFAIQLAGTQPRDTASLLEGLITVTATLPSAKADPAKDVIVTVTTAWNEEPLKSTGLPFARDIPINNAVLRLTVEASDVSGYASAALTTCARSS